MSKDQVKIDVSNSIFQLSPEINDQLKGAAQVAASIGKVTSCFIVVINSQPPKVVSHYGMRNAGAKPDTSLLYHMLCFEEEVTTLKDPAIMTVIDSWCETTISHALCHSIKSKHGESIGWLILMNSGQIELSISENQSLHYFKESIVTLAETQSEIIALKKIEEDHESLLENLGDGIMELDEHGACIYANRKMQKIFNRTTEELNEMTAWKCVLDEDVHKMQAYYVDKFRKKSSSGYYEYRIVPKDGQPIWVAQSTTMKYRGMKMIRMRCVIRNLSLTKILTHKLELKESLYKLVSQNSTDLIALHDAKGRFIFLSLSVKDFLGYESDEIIGKSALSFIHPEDRSRTIENSFKKVLGGTSTSSVICRLKTKKNDYIWIESDVKPISHKHNSSVSFQTSSRNITRDWLENQRREKFRDGLMLLNSLSSKTGSQLKIIQEALELVSTYFGMENGIISEIKGRKYRIKYFNSSMTENPKKKVFDLNQTYCDLTIKQGNELYIDEMSRSSYSDHPCLKAFGFESYIGAVIYSDGNVFGTVNFSNSSKRSADFTSYDKEFMRLFANWIGSFVKRLRERRQLEKAKREAERASVAKANFLSTMSHEIRTPLNGIIGATHLLLQKNPRNSQKMQLEILEQSGNNLLAIVNDILDFNKIEEGKLILENSSFNLKELAQIIHSNYSIQAEDTVKVNLHYDSSLNDFYIGDSVRISQVLHNLMSNALKFTDAGHVNLSFFKRDLHDKHDEIFVEISDSGCGISKEKSKKVFRVFVQAEMKSTKTGSGLGLPISQKLLELMDSKIELETKLGIGSSFSFNLILKRDLNPIRNKKSANKGHKAEFDSLEAKILLVEDNKFNRIIACDFLTSWGCNVIEADDGAKAIDYLTSHQDIDLVLLDLQMPVLNGFETAMRVRAAKDDYYQNLPIIGLTASAQIESMEQAFKSGMNDFITKPFHPSEFYRKLKQYLKHKQSAENEKQLFSQIFSRLNKTAGRDEIRIEKYLNAFYESLKEEEILFKEAIRKGKLDEIKAYCHKNKTGMKLVGLDDYVDQMENIENMIQNQNLKSMILYRAGSHHKDLLFLLRVLLKGINHE